MITFKGQRYSLSQDGYFRTTAHGKMGGVKHTMLAGGIGREGNREAVAHEDIEELVDVISSALSPRTADQDPILARQSEEIFSKKQLGRIIRYKAEVVADVQEKQRGDEAAAAAKARADEIEAAEEAIKRQDPSYMASLRGLQDLYPLMLANLSDGTPLQGDGNIGITMFPDALAASHPIGLDVGSETEDLIIKFQNRSYHLSKNGEFRYLVRGYGDPDPVQSILARQRKGENWSRRAIPKSEIDNLVAKIKSLSLTPAPSSSEVEAPLPPLDDPIFDLLRDGLKPSITARPPTPAVEVVSKSVEISSIEKVVVAHARDEADPILLHPKLTIVGRAEEVDSGSKFDFATRDKSVVDSPKNTSKEIILAQLNAAVKFAGVSKVQAALFIMIAIKNGGIKNSEAELRGDFIKLGCPKNDLEANVSQAIKFSKAFQDGMKTAQMYTGNQNASDKFIGMRLKRLTPDYVLEMFKELPAAAAITPGETQTPEQDAQSRFDDLIEKLGTNLADLTRQKPSSKPAPSSAFLTSTVRGAKGSRSI